MNHGLSNIPIGISQLLMGSNFDVENKISAYFRTINYEDVANNNKQKERLYQDQFFSHI
jgi:hypothetical protein